MKEEHSDSRREKDLSPKTEEEKRDMEQFDNLFSAFMADGICVVNMKEASPEDLENFFYHVFGE